MPLMRSRESAGSMTANLAEDEPQLRTRTFMVVGAPDCFAGWHRPT